MDKTALFSLSYGLYIIGVTRQDGSFGGRVLDALLQVSSGEKPQLAVSFMKEGDAVTAVREVKNFTVSVMPEDVHPFVIGNFGYQSGSTVDKWANVPHDLLHGVPILRDAVSYLYLEVDEIRELDTHTLCLCTLKDATLGRKAEPLLYGDYFKSYKSAVQAAFQKAQESGTVPGSNLKPAEDNTDTPQPEEHKEPRWVCTLCGYVYDGEIPFADLPADWRCPLCGAGKDAFVRQVT